MMKINTNISYIIHIIHHIWLNMKTAQLAPVSPPGSSISKGFDNINIIFLCMGEMFLFIDQFNVILQDISSVHGKN